MEQLSKELIGEVLGNNVVKVWTEGSNILYTVLYTEGVHLASVNFSINKYELMHNMKQWALGQEYSITSGLAFAEKKLKEYYGDEFSIQHKAFCNYERLNYTFDDDRDFTKATTEFEAVYKACQWIKENK